MTIDKDGRVCTKCKGYFPWKDFHLSRGHSYGHTVICKSCARQKALKYTIDVFTAYGEKADGKWKCACPGCDFTHESNHFFTLAHTFNNGAADRQAIQKEVKSRGGKGSRNGTIGYNFMIWVRRHGYPKDRGYQIWCWNCNGGAKGNRGICPHMEER